MTVRVSVNYMRCYSVSVEPSDESRQIPLDVFVIDMDWHTKVRIYTGLSHKANVPLMQDNWWGLSGQMVCPETNASPVITGPALRSTPICSRTPRILWHI
jgi:hypothetical protein